MRADSKSAMRVALMTALAIAGATPAAAQDYSYSAAWNAGAIGFTKLNGNSASGGVELKPSVSWVAGLQAEHWLGWGQLGLRFEGAYSRSPMTVPGGPDRSLGMALGDVGLLLRLVPARPGNTVAPYVGVGGGFMYYGLGAGDSILYPAANAKYKGGNHLEPALVGSFGVDVLTSMRWDDDPVGIRIEASDLIARSPFKPLTGSSFSPVHTARVLLGVFAGAGVLH